MRRPAVAGSFYPRHPDELREELEAAFSDAVGSETLPIRGAVVPHAGYIYSGAVAAEVYARLPERETFVLIGPNHQGLGLPVALSRDSWMTPLGVAECDLELADALTGSIVEVDESAHLYEHSLEVQIPFLQSRFKGFKILPICMGLQDEETAVEVGEAVGEAAERLGRDCTVIASSDLTHYEPQDEARRKDARVIEAILRMDVPSIYKTVYGLNLTACGYGPISAAITASKILGAETGKLLRYSTSGDVIGDFSQVVGYGAIAFV
ncbi:MEMO1 family protein [Methanocrinis sp.]|uniref:MEMO1 family protein n=1 Tax=Methanocrinis sp. TaxID=3101522 RepID=UPI003D0C8881